MDVLGLPIKLKLTDKQQLNGRIYALSPNTNTLILEQNLSRNKSSFQIVNFEFIEDIEIEGNGGPVYSAISHPKYVHVDRFTSRQQRSRIVFQQQLSRLGKNVSARAQEIFDMISRTAPCRWEEPDIIVFDQVRVRPPYMTPESCQLMPAHNELDQGPSEDHATLQRVRKILEGVRQRILSKSI
jgi:hypothetical protein